MITRLGSELVVRTSAAVAVTIQQQQLWVSWVDSSAQQKWIFGTPNAFGMTAKPGGHGTQTESCLADVCRDSQAEAPLLREASAVVETQSHGRDGLKVIGDSLVFGFLWVQLCMQASDASFPS